MVTISSSLKNYFQVQPFYTSVDLFFASLFERTDTAFQRVHIMKRNQDGNIKLYHHKDKTTGKETRSAVLSYIEDVKTGDMYLDEPTHVISVKCAFVALAIPFYTIGKMCWHGCKIPIEITALVLEIFSKTSQQPVFCRFYEGLTGMHEKFSEISNIVGQGLFNVIKAPIFGLGAELAALYGIVRPYHGRKWEALIENTWQNGASYKVDFRSIPAKPGENCWEAFVNDIRKSHPFYLAYCFQVRHNINDPRIILIRRESI